MNNLNFENLNSEQVTIDNSISNNCRRYQLDRRVTNLSFIERLLHRGERSEHRRNTDRENFIHFDRHEPHLLLISTIVILCSIFDAILTLKILASGGVELNYFADILIGFGLYGFIFSKYLITAVGMIVLVIHKHYEVFFGLQVRHIIYSIVFIYSVLITYEVIIIIIY